MSVQIKVRSSEGSWDAWHCKVAFCPTVTSMFVGARMILVGAVQGKEQIGSLKVDTLVNVWTSQRFCVCWSFSVGKAKSSL